MKFKVKLELDFRNFFMLVNEAGKVVYQDRSNEKVKFIFCDKIENFDDEVILIPQVSKGKSDSGRYPCTLNFKIYKPASDDINAVEGVLIREVNKGFIYGYECLFWAVFPTPNESLKLTYQIKILLEKTCSR